MIQKIISVLFVVVFLCGRSWGAMVCDATLDFPIVEEVVLTNTGWEYRPSACATSGADVTSQKWGAWLSDAHYVDGCGAHTCWEESNCTVFKYQRGCPEAVKDGIGNTSMVVLGSATLTGVAAGEEKDAAEAWATSWFESNNYPSDPPRVRTDASKGFSFTATLGESDNSVDVEVIAWKRASFTAGGAIPVPLADVQGTGGGGGGTVNFDYGQMAGSVGSGLNSETGQLGMHEAFLSALDDADLTAANRKGLDTESAFDALENAYLAGYIGPGGSSGGMSYEQMVSALSAVENSTPVEVGSLADHVGTEFTVAPEKRSALVSSLSDGAGTAFSDFKTSIQGTGVYGLIGTFFGNIPSGGSAGSQSFNAGVFGAHSFDYSSLSAPLLAMRGVVLLASIFVSLRIVVLKGGGG